jgi:hypothetical protein
MDSVFVRCDACLRAEGEHFQLLLDVLLVRMCYQLQYIKLKSVYSVSTVNRNIGERCIEYRFANRSVTWRTIWPYKLNIVIKVATIALWLVPVKHWDQRFEFQLGRGCVPASLFYVILWRRWEDLSYMQFYQNLQIKFINQTDRRSCEGWS